MSNICTWKGCQHTAVYRQLDKNATQWAYLCEEHTTELNYAIKHKLIPKILSCWIKAQGGAAKAASRVTPRTQGNT